MATKVKPVQASEIRDIKIIREAIAQVRRRPTAEDWADVRAWEAELDRVLRK
jgi:hypothetical protein